MEKNIENNTENKFGNFLNFMKKFLAMSFFCAIAAFGFGALNAKATPLSNTTKDYYSNVDDINDSSKKISGVDETDFAKYKEENDGVLYHDNNTDVTAYALKRDSSGKVEEKTDLEISALERAGDDLSKPVTKIHTQLIDDGVTDLTIKGYDVVNDTGNVAKNGTGTNKLKSLTVTNWEGKAVTKDALTKAKNDFASLVNNASTDIKTPSALKLSTTNLVVDNSKSWDKPAIKTEIENKIKVTKLDGTQVTGTWGTLTDVFIGKYKIDYTPTSDTTLPMETFEITVTTGTPAKAEKTEVEYEAGKTTWGEILKNAKVNTSAENGAKGSWKVTTDKVEGTIIDYGSGLEYLGKMEPGLTEATLTYISGEGDSFADADSITIFLKDRTEDLKEFGNYEFKTFGDYTFFVNKDTGSTCTMLSSEKGQISWLREESYGTAAWYGFDNSEGALPEGSIVSVKWYGKDDEGYSEKLEKAAKGIQSLGIVAEKDKIWVFELNAYKKVKDDNGTVKYEKVSDFDGKKLKMYIELGNDWDMNDAKLSLY